MPMTVNQKAAIVTGGFAIAVAIPIAEIYPEIGLAGLGTVSLVFVPFLAAVFVVARFAFKHHRPAVSIGASFGDSGTLVTFFGVVVSIAVALGVLAALIRFIKWVWDW
jgi:F0F1-type ATP synthase assembly protein I